MFPTMRILAAVLLLSIASNGLATDPITLQPNGGWCWFQAERVVVVDGKIVFTSVAGDDSGDSDAGDLVATSFDPASKQIEHFVLHPKFQRDDHDVASLCVLADGRLLAVYGKHGSDHLQRWRMTQHPGTINSWTEEQTFDVGAGYTYANVFRLSGENDRIYNFHRGRGFNPNCTISDDGGESWRYGWRLLEWTRDDLKDDPRYTGLDGTRPYVVYNSNSRDSVHFMLSDDHPRAYDNSIYHGFYRNGKLHRSNGDELATELGARSTLKPNSFTEVFAGGADRVAWASDLELDEAGNPFLAFSVQVDGAASRTGRGQGGQDHRYYYGRWDGAQWHVHQIAYAGSKLYAGEDDYTGLVALDPHDPNVAVISTNADPTSGKPIISASDGLRHWELYRGRTGDGGKTWKWTALTSNSITDQLRPVIPAQNGTHFVLWAQGHLKSYTNFHLDIVAMEFND